MSKHDFTKVQHENALAILFSMVLSVRKLITAFWPLLVIYFFKEKRNLFPAHWLYLGTFVIFILIILHSYLSWRNFFFYIKNNEFVVEKGYLRKKIIALPLEKIVSINTNQELLHRLLGVVEVAVDSTGTDKKEIKIKAVKQEYALALEKALSNANTAYFSKENAEPNQEQKKIIISHSPLHLLKVGISRNHLQGLLLVLLFVNQIHNELRDIFKEEIETVLAETTTTLEQSNLALWIGIFIFVIFFSFTISLIRTFLFFFDLQLLRVKETFLLQLGLLKRKKISVPFSRIQAIRYTANPLQRGLKISTTQLVQASGKIMGKDKDKVLILGCTKEQKHAIQSTIFPHEFSDPIRLKPHWALRNRLFFIGIALFAIPSLIPVFLLSWQWIFVFLGIVFSVAAISQLNYKRRTYTIDEELVLISEGYLTQKETILEHYKVQTIRISQSFFQKRRGTATLHLSVAGNAVDLAYIPIEKAQKLRDFFLYKIIETKKNWM